MVLRSFEFGYLSEANTCAILDAVESFLFRRAISGIEPTGLHAVFKGLWQELAGTAAEEELDEAVTADRVRNAISNKATVVWPKADDFRVAVETGELYRRKIAAYALREYELSLKGETPADAHQIEHIAPQNATELWKEAIPEDYERLLHTWGNLLPLTPTMNPSQGQNDFSLKKAAFADSIFASAREVAKEAVWNAQTIKNRSKRIADWALTRWPY